ncbi:MAG TPA: acetylxylan esterase [Chthoniobacterales bacterium]
MLAPDQIAITDFGPYLAKYPFDPTNGFSLAELRQLRVAEKAPPDFVDFWQNAHERSRAVDPRAEFRPSGFAAPDHDLRELHFHSLGGFAIGAWLAEPRDRNRIRRVEIFGHGYGGRSEPDRAALAEEAVQLFVCAPGFDLSACPDRVATNAAMLHVLTGIHSPETYILLACAAAVWTAARVMDDLFPGLPQVYRGGSFGGGIGALLLPWESRFVAAELVQPTFGYHTLRLRHRSTGSGESVRRLHELQPSIRRTLAYFDAAYAARHLKVPVAVAACAFDPAVCPPGQFAVANAIPGDLRRVSEFSFGHCDFPHPDRAFEDQRHREQLAAILAKI